MKEFPKEWCTYVCQEVIQYLNNKYNYHYLGDSKFYGENIYETICREKTFGTYLSHEEFMEAIGTVVPPTMKVGDMVWVSLVSEHSAKEFKTERELLAILPENILGRRYICRNNEFPVLTASWTYAVPIVKEERKERKLMLTDQEWEKLEKVYK